MRQIIVATFEELNVLLFYDSVYILSPSLLDNHKTEDVISLFKTLRVFGILKIDLMICQR